MGFKIRGPRTLFSGKVVETRTETDPDGKTMYVVVLADNTGDRDTLTLRSGWRGITGQMREGARFNVELSRTGGDFTRQEDLK